MHNPVTSHRFLVDHPGGYHWVDGRGRTTDVADVADFRLTVHEPGPDWLRDGVVYQVFPDRFARSRTSGDLDLPDWAVPAPSWDAEPPLAGREAAATVYGETCAGSRERLDHLEQLRGGRAVPDPGVRGTLGAPLRRGELRPGRPAPRGRRGARRALRGRARAACGSWATSRPTTRGRPRVVHPRARGPLGARGGPSTGPTPATSGGRATPAAQARLGEHRACAPHGHGRGLGDDPVAARALRARRWRVDVANMTGRLGGAGRRLARRTPHAHRDGRGSPLTLPSSPSTRTTRAPTSRVTGGTRP